MTSFSGDWQRDESDLQFNIGFLHSSCTIKNFHLNTAALNELLDGSTRYRFKDVSVQELSPKFCTGLSPFSLSDSLVSISGFPWAIAGVVAYNNHKLKKEAARVSSDESQPAQSSSHSNE